MSPQDQLDDSILNSLKSYDLSQYSFRVDVVPNVLDQWRQNFQYALGPSNPAFVDATLSSQDILVWGYTLQYNQNGILWRVGPAGRPHPDDYHKFLEQNRVIQRATERTIVEIKPLLDTSQVARVSSQSQPNPAESSTVIKGSNPAFDTSLNASYQSPRKPFYLPRQDTKDMEQADNFKSLNPLRYENWGYFSQRDPLWGKEPYTITGDVDQNIAESACGPTAMAMAVKRLRPNENVTPFSMVRLSLAMETRTLDYGVDHSFFRKAAEHYGLNYEPATHASSVQNALQNGNAVVIAAMGSGHFTSSGHIVLIVGKEILNGVEYYKIFDPNDANGSYYKDGKDGVIMKTMYPGIVYAKTSVVHTEAANLYIISKPTK